MATDVLTLEQLVVFAVIFVLCTIGSYAKDTVDTFTGRSEKILLKVIVISSLIVSVLLWSFSETIIGKIGFKPLIALSLIMGIVSYDVTLKLVNLGAGDVFKIFFKRDYSSLGLPSKSTDESEKKE